MTGKPDEESLDGDDVKRIARDLRAVEAAVRAIGGKWKVMIVANLSDGSLRFSELRRRMPLISQQSLTTQLRQLERDGVLSRAVYAEVPPRVEYSLSEVGRRISPLMPSLMAWGYELLKLRGDTAL
jgi:DNA-binding HxlR family transcriptional regulator